MESNAVNKFKPKESNKTEPIKTSRYFKPGFIYNKNSTTTNNADNENKQQQKVVPKKNATKVVEEHLLDSEDDDYLEEVISQATSQSKLPQSQPSTSKNVAPLYSKASTSSLSTKPDEAMERVNQVDTQTVDFTSETTNAVIPSLKGSNTILVSSNQKQNPLLQNLRTVRYVITDSIAPAHYVLFDSCCALFLSLKYHVIHPNYIYERISELRDKYQLKILLVMIDHIIYEKSLKELSILAVRTNYTLMLAWTYDEAARHLENYRINADKPADIIMGRFDDSSRAAPANQQQSLIDALTSVKAVNRTDAITLLSTFESVDNIIKANTDELTICPGISMVKARRLHTLFNKPFIKSKFNVEK